MAQHRKGRRFFPPDPHVPRREFLRLAGAVGGTVALSGCKKDSSTPQQTSTPAPATSEPVVAAQKEMAKFPEKTDLILLTDRPPQLETPLKYFETDLTPNEAFFVRWHLADIPTSVDLSKFRLAIGGHVNTPLTYSIDQLKSGFEPVSIVAVNQCSGNSRSLFEPRVPGGQWGHGAVGNAKWTGVRLADLLDKAGLKSGGVDVSFQGLDRPVLPQTPAFIKSLKLDKARDKDVIVAYAMNDQPMPMLNGFPIRLIVPGWYATYWVKALNEINILNEPFKGFWMDKAYRIADNPHANETPDKLAADTVPINTMTVRSLIVRPQADDRVSAGKASEIQGIAFDGGKGIAKVEVSTDGGSTWQPAALDADKLGNYSWRRFRYTWTPAAAGPAKLMTLATNAAGETQETSQWNRSGYARDVIETVNINVA
jgi:DMSO/TMAO reductase YedYZ molybdopterin-dependent catalytic subunit